jgi:hypothetical protein
MADFSTETLKARRAWSEVFRAVNENNFNHRLHYPANLSFKIDGAIKIFHKKQKLKQYMPQQKILQGILHTKDENKQNHERMGSIKNTRNQRVAFIQLHTIKCLNNKNN